MLLVGPREWEAGCAVAGVGLMKVWGEEAVREAIRCLGKAWEDLWRRGWMDIGAMERMLSWEFDLPRRGRKVGLAKGVESVLESGIGGSVGSDFAKSGSGSSGIMSLFILGSPTLEMRSKWSLRLSLDREVPGL